MKTKVCSRCKLEKHPCDFKRQSTSNDGLGDRCKFCAQSSPSSTRGSLEYFKLVSWSAINRRTVNGSKPSVQHYLKKNIQLMMSKKEFYAWCDAHKDLILAFYEEANTPSVDRIDPLAHYSVDNIQIISHEENSMKGVMAHAEKSAHGIVGINIKTGVIRRFPSKKAACRNGFEWRGLYTHMISKTQAYHKDHVFFLSKDFDADPARCISEARKVRPNPKVEARLKNQEVVSAAPDATMIASEFCG